MKEVPLFVLNGFLESGKTTLIKEIIENNENYQSNSTVIIVCEQGEIEYNDEWCEKYGVHVEYIEDQSEFTPDYMRNLDNMYMADQYVIEYNSFFDFDAQEFPNYMVIYQQITLINAQNFALMFNNMKKIFQSMVQYSSLVIFNRCEGVNDLSQYRRQIRAMNQQAQIAFEQADGRLTAMLDEDLPYDLSKDVIAFEEDIYPIWYVEVFDNYEKYYNKLFKFKTFVRDITKKTFVIGRNVMTCCENDIQFLGYEVINETSVKPKLDDCIYLECTVHHEYSKMADEEVVMLHAKKITILSKEEEKVLSM
ncbi:MAG: GTP-binding protein [Anaeroplasma sp.]